MPFAAHQTRQSARISVESPPTHRRQRRCETGKMRSEKGNLRIQARGGPREEERKARSEGSRKRDSDCSMRSRVGWATRVDTGGAVTCTDCHSQTGQWAGAGPLASSVKADCRDSCADRGAPDVSDVTCVCVSAPNVLKNTYSSDTNAASLRFAGEVSDKNRLPEISPVYYTRSLFDYSTQNPLFCKNSTQNTHEGRVACA